MKKICSMIVFICGLKSSAEGQLFLKTGIAFSGYQKINRPNFDLGLFYKFGNPANTVSPTLGGSTYFSLQRTTYEGDFEEGRAHGLIVPQIKIGAIIKVFQKISIHPEAGGGILLGARRHNKPIIPLSLGFYYKFPNEGIMISAGFTQIVRPQKDFIPPAPHPGVRIIEPIKGTKYPDFSMVSLQIAVAL